MRRGDRKCLDYSWVFLLEGESVNFCFVKQNAGHYENKVEWSHKRLHVYMCNLTVTCVMYQYSVGWCSNTSQMSTINQMKVGSNRVQGNSGTFFDRVSVHSQPRAAPAEKHADKRLIWDEPGLRSINHQRLAHIACQLDLCPTRFWHTRRQCVLTVSLYRLLSPFLVASHNLWTTILLMKNIYGIKCKVPQTWVKKFPIIKRATVLCCVTWLHLFSQPYKS